MSDDNVLPFDQSPKNIARLQKLVRELAMDSSQVRLAVQGLGQGKWANVTDYDVHKMLRTCRLENSLERKSEGEWVVRAMGQVGGVTLIAVTVIVHRMWLVVTELERVK